MIRYKQIDLSSPDLLLVRMLYEQSFPEEERLDFEALLQLAEQADVEFMAAYVAGRFAGFTYTFTYGRFCWGFYFAVRPELRGNGVGRQMLQALLERHRDKLFVIDIEDLEQPSEQQGTSPKGLAVSEMRHRRHAFYLRAGLRDTDIRRAYAGVAYRIMVCGEGTILDEEYQMLIDIMWEKIKKNKELS